MNYYERHLGDLAKDTGHLSQGQLGAYDLLMDWYYANERALPADKADLYRIGRAFDKAERANVDRVASMFFAKDGDVLRHKRIDAEIARFNEKREKAKRSANARWEAMRTQCDGNANASETHGERICVQHALQSPVTIEQQKKPAAPSPEEIIWGDGLQFLTARGVKEPSARTFLGGLIKQHGAAEVLRGLGAAIDADAGEPKAYIAAVLNKARTGHARAAI